MIFQIGDAITMEFFLNVFTEFSEFSDKNICHYSKRAQTCHPATSCVRDRDATTASARHMWETGSLNQAQFMLQWLSDSLNLLNSVKVLLHLGKTPMNGVPWMWHFAAKNRMKRRILLARGERMQNRLRSASMFCAKNWSEKYCGF